MSVQPGPSGHESLVVDDEGIVRLQWPAGVRITGASARAALDAVNRLCGSARRPLLVDMATTTSVAREARAVFGEPSAASRISLLDRSPVDRVIANFTLAGQPGAVSDPVLHRPRPGAGFSAGGLRDAAG